MAFIEISYTQSYSLVPLDYDPTQDGYVRTGSNSVATYSWQAYSSEEEIVFGGKFLSPAYVLDRGYLSKSVLALVDGEAYNPIRNEFGQIVGYEPLNARILITTTYTVNSLSDGIGTPYSISNGTPPPATIQVISGGRLNGGFGVGGYTGQIGYNGSLTEARLFTEQIDVVDFNNLSEAQKQLVANGAEKFDALGGSDHVTLPGSGAQVSAGWDVLRWFLAGEGNDTVFGSDLDDRIDGGPGNDNLFGGFGSDTLVGGSGRNLLDGGPDIDTALYLGHSVRDFRFDFPLLAPQGTSLELSQPLIIQDAIHDILTNIEIIRFADYEYFHGPSARLGVDAAIAVLDAAQKFRGLPSEILLAANPSAVGSAVGATSARMTALVQEQLRSKGLAIDIAIDVGMAGTVLMDELNRINLNPNQDQREIQTRIAYAQFQAEATLAVANQVGKALTASLVGAALVTAAVTYATALTGTAALALGAIGLAFPITTAVVTGAAIYLAYSGFSTIWDSFFEEHVQSPLKPIVEQYYLGEPRGFSLNGYVAGATVTFDENGNGIAEADEFATLTDSAGRFISSGVPARLLSNGGVDTSTGLPNAGQMEAPPGYIAITPITTLIALAKDLGTADAEEVVLLAFGLTPELDVASFDPLAALLAGDPSGTSLYLAGVKAYLLARLVGAAAVALGEDRADGIRAGFVELALAAARGDLDIDDASFLAASIEASLSRIGASASDNIVQSIASVAVAAYAQLDAVSAANEPPNALFDAISALKLVLLGAAGEAIERSVGHPSILDAIADTFTGDSLAALVALAAIDLSAPGQNQAPIAMSLTANTKMNTGLTGVLAGADIDLDPLAFIIAAGPSQGEIALDGASFTYTPFSGFHGTDSFTFIVNDGALNSALATVTIQVNPDEQPPDNTPATIAGVLAGTVTEDGTLTATGALTIVDPDEGEASFRPGTIAGAYGSLALTAAGAWTYTLSNSLAAVQALNTGETLTDTLEVLSIDGTAASVTITIQGADEAAPPSNVIMGTKKADKINGTVQDDVIIPLGGSDKVYGKGGNDVIIATVGDGNDTYDGGAGIDTVDYSALLKGVSISLDSHCNRSAKSEEAGKDKLISIENMIGSQGADNITGSKAANVLFGGDGNDRIDGRKGGDVIEGGAGNDKLTGGSGSDTFVFKPGFGRDTITDFDASPKGGQDYILLEGFGITGDNFADHVKIADVGKHTLITIDGDLNQTILLSSLRDAASITVDDFRFA